MPKNIDSLKLNVKNKLKMEIPLRSYGTCMVSSVLEGEEELENRSSGAAVGTDHFRQSGSSLLKGRVPEKAGQSQGIISNFTWMKYLIHIHETDEEERRLADKQHLSIYGDENRGKPGWAGPNHLAIRKPVKNFKKEGNRIK